VQEPDLRPVCHRCEGTSAQFAAHAVDDAA
jgi:hypothetical protein